MFHDLPRLQVPYSDSLPADISLITSQAEPQLRFLCAHITETSRALPCALQVFSYARATPHPVPCLPCRTCTTSSFAPTASGRATPSSAPASPPAPAPPLPALRLPRPLLPLPLPLTGHGLCGRVLCPAQPAASPALSSGIPSRLSRYDTHTRGARHTRATSHS